MLKGVVSDQGTGELAAIPGYSVAGKTGTAQKPGPNGYIPGAYVATFVGMVPASNPRLVVLVSVDEPRGGDLRRHRRRAGVRADRLVRPPVPRGSARPAVPVGGASPSRAGWRAQRGQVHRWRRRSRSRPTAARCSGSRPRPRSPGPRVRRAGNDVADRDRGERAGKEKEQRAHRRQDQPQPQHRLRQRRAEHHHEEGEHRQDEAGDRAGVPVTVHEYILADGPGAPRLSARAGGGAGAPFGRGERSRV